MSYCIKIFIKNLIVYIILFMENQNPYPDITNEPLLNNQRAPPPPPPTWNNINLNPNPNPNYSPYAPHTQHYQNPNAQVSGNQPNNQGFNLNNQGFQPNNQGFQANNQGFQPNNQGFQPNNQGFQPNNQGFEPNGKLHCPFCGKWTESFPKKIAGGVTYAWCICLFFFTGIFCCVPFCVGGCKDTQMVCVVCQQAKARIPAKCC